MADRGFQRPDDDTDHPWFAALITALMLTPAGGVLYAILRVGFDASPRHAGGGALGVVLVPTLLALFWPRGVAGRIEAVWKLVWVVLKGFT